MYTCTVYNVHVHKIVSSFSNLIYMYMYMCCDCKWHYSRYIIMYMYTVHLALT